MATTTGISGEALLDDMASALDVLVGGVSALPGDELAGLRQGIGRVRAGLDRLSLVISQRADNLHGEGKSQDARGLWDTPDDTGDPGEGRRQARRADTAQRAPKVAAGFLGGRISSGHVDVLAKVCGGLDSELRRAFEALDNDIAEQAAVLDVAGFEQWCRRRIDAVARQLGRDRHQRQLRKTQLRRWTNVSTGMLHLAGAFHPELGQRLFRALDAEIEQLRVSGQADGPGDGLSGPLRDETVHRDHLAAHALGRLVLGTHRAKRPGVAEISIIVDQHTLVSGMHDHSRCEHHDGTPLPWDTLQRHACLAALHRIILSPDGVPLDAGRSTRLANRDQRRALRAAYRTCAWQSCTVPFHLCEIHHLHPWDDGGPTDLHNLLPLCVRHHHHAHELGWQLHLHADRSLTITRPDGSHHATTAPPRSRPARTGGAPPGRGRARSPGGAPPGGPSTERTAS